MTRSDVIAFRFLRHQLDRPPESVDAIEVDLLDIGVQDTGTEGSGWALAVRGARPPQPDELFLAWTIRGAPHAYRRRDVAAVVTATAPLSEADAAARIYDAAKPLRQAGISVVEALTTVAKEMRDIARNPVSKGGMSGALTDRLDRPFLRDCKPCNAVHIHEQLFRQASLQAGLELDPGTSPPVLRRIRGLRPTPYKRLGTEADPQHDVVRGYLRFFGPAPVKAIAAFLDAPQADVKAHLPEDAVEVEGGFVLAGDLDELEGASERLPSKPTVRLLGSHDPYLQLRDREVLVPDTARHRDLWRTLGRPGAVVVDGEVVGTWRPRASGKALSIEVDQWTPVKPAAAVAKAVGEEAERLAACRGVGLRAVTGI